MVKVRQDGRGEARGRTENVQDLEKSKGIPQEAKSIMRVKELQSFTQEL